MGSAGKPGGPGASWLLCLLGVTALALWIAPSRAEARKRIVVMPFSGPRAGATTSAVKRKLAGRFRVVSTGAFARASRRGGRGAAGRRAGARALRVSAIVRGSMTRSGGRWMLRVSVFSGRTGARVGGRNFPLRGTRIDSSTARRVGAVLARFVARTRAPASLARARRRPRRAPAYRRPPPRPRPQPTPRPVAPAPAAQQPSSGFDDGSDIDTSHADEPQLTDATAPTSTPPRRVAAHQPPPAAVPADDDIGFQVTGNKQRRRRRRVARRDDGEARVRRRSRDDDDEERRGNPRRRRSLRRPWQSIIEVSAGVILLKRTFNFNEPVDPQDPPDYKTPGVVPALYLEGSVYPLTAFTRGLITGLGLAGRYYRVLGLKSRVDGAAALADTVVQEFEVGPRYRWNILGKRSSPTLRFGFDYGQMSFSIVNNQTKLPNINYTYLKLALLGVEVPIYCSRTLSFGASASFDYLVVLSAGDIDGTDQAGYGESSTGGIDLGVGVYASYSGFFAKITGFYRRFFYSFDGVCYQQRTGCNYAGGALDIYAGVALNVGYAY